MSTVNQNQTTQGDVKMNLKIRLFSVVLFACATFGCTSFRTTSLYRLANDSLAPQRTNKKLKGLPVKLKVPSHVSVVVYEQQVILGTASEELKDLNKAVDLAAEIVQQKESSLKKLDDDVDQPQSTIDNTERTITNAIARRDASPNQRDKNAYDALIKKETAIKAAAEANRDSALETRTTEQPNLEAELALAKGKLVLAIAAATPGYAIVSFSPPQYQVETQLEYTDKIFLIDFKRPAAGTLDLKNAKMDDQQYFSQVQAEIEEKTIESIGGALKTITNPLVSLGQKKSNSAKPTSASTPEGESKDDVHFQKSVVAIQRFDISEPGWEDEMMWFVNEKLGASSGASVEMEGLVGQLSQR